MKNIVYTRCGILEISKKSGFEQLRVFKKALGLGTESTMNNV